MKVDFKTATSGGAHHAGRSLVLLVSCYGSRVAPTRPVGRLGALRFPRSGPAPWARRDGLSLAQHGSPGIHAGRPTTQHLLSASRGADRSKSRRGGRPVWCASTAQSCVVAEERSEAATGCAEPFSLTKSEGPAAAVTGLVMTDPNHPVEGNCLGVLGSFC